MTSAERLIYRNQTKILIWLWLCDLPIADRHVMEIEERCYGDTWRAKT